MEQQELTPEQQEYAARQNEIRTNAFLEDLTQQNTALVRRTAQMAGEIAVLKDLIDQLNRALQEVQKAVPEIDAVNS